jgi:hypothetical protein
LAGDTDLTLWSLPLKLAVDSEISSQIKPYLDRAQIIDCPIKTFLITPFPCCDLVIWFDSK